MSDERKTENLPEKVDLMSLCGIIKPKVGGVTIEEMDEAIRERACSADAPESPHPAPSSASKAPASS